MTWVVLGYSNWTTRSTDVGIIDGSRCGEYIGVRGDLGMDIILGKAIKKEKTAETQRTQS
jgi:hypothetical protein